jgi:hypothetical protein
MTKQSRGRSYADLLLMSAEHYAAYDAATVAIQRQTNESTLGKLGFSTLNYIGGGKRAEIVLDGGIGSNMPADTTFGLNTDSFPPALQRQSQTSTSCSKATGRCRLTRMQSPSSSAGWANLRL